MTTGIGYLAVGEGRLAGQLQPKSTEIDRSHEPDLRGLHLEHHATGIAKLGHSSTTSNGKPGPDRRISTRNIARLTKVSGAADKICGRNANRGANTDTTHTQPIPFLI